jgi:aconitate decarboxylase
LHFVITAALDARTAIADPAAIDSVTLRIPVIPYLDRPAPLTGLDGKFSWQYTTAAALLDARVDKATFSDQRRFARDMEQFLPRIHLAADRTIPPRFDRMHAVIDVRLTDGTKVERRCDAPIGHWRRPVPPSTVEAKARTLLVNALGTKNADKLRELLDVPHDRLAVAPIMALIREPA